MPSSIKILSQYGVEKTTIAVSEHERTHTFKPVARDSSNLMPLDADSKRRSICFIFQQKGVCSCGAYSI